MSDVEIEFELLNILFSRFHFQRPKKLIHSLSKKKEKENQKQKQKKRKEKKRNKTSTPPIASSSIFLSLEVFRTQVFRHFFKSCSKRFEIVFWGCYFFLRFCEKNKVYFSLFLLNFLFHFFLFLISLSIELSSFLPPSSFPFFPRIYKKNVRLFTTILILSNRSFWECIEVWSWLGLG